MANRGEVPPPRLVHAMQALLAEHGVVKVAQIVGLGREGVLRIAAKQPVQRGTIALAEKNVTDLDPQA